MKKIDLGKKISESDKLADSPIGESRDKTYFPSLYLDGDSLEGIPDNGEAIITFKVSRRSETESNGKKNYSVSMDVKSIRVTKENESDDDEEDDTSPMSEHDESRRVVSDYMDKKGIE